MAQIVLKGSTVADFSVSGTTVVVAGHQVDCAERQSDAEEIIEIRGSAKGPVEGGAGAYLAVIRIPARRYHGEPGPNDAQDNPTVVQVAEPLDPHSIEITLWPTA
jgi:hypothetical protein